EISLAEEEVPLEKKQLKDLIVVLVAIESEDDESTVSAAVNDIKEYSNLVNCTKILIYPYAHLSPNLAGPHRALDLLRSLEQASGKEFSNVVRAPFGWTKSFSIKVKGHPLAESSKIISGRNYSDIHRSQVQLSDALKAEEVHESHWYILGRTGIMTPLK